MWKVLTFSVALITTIDISSTLAAPVALDHLKKDLDSRFNEVKSSENLHPSEKARALSELRILQSRYSTALSHSVIPSQRSQAENEARRLNRELQSFDRKLTRAKLDSTRNKKQEEEFKPEKSRPKKAK